MESKPKLDMDKLKQVKQTYKYKITEPIPVTKDLENKNIYEINTAVDLYSSKGRKSSCTNQNLKGKLYISRNKEFNE